MSPLGKTVLKHKPASLTILHSSDGPFAFRHSLTTRIKHFSVSREAATARPRIQTKPSAATRVGRDKGVSGAHSHAVNDFNKHNFLTQ
jgi:hypothetical protein